MDEPEPAGWSEILADRTDEVASTARRLRSAALTAIPELTERVYPGWRALGLRHPTAGLIATVFPRDADVAVYFERGAQLPDPYGHLEGDGRLRRTRMLVMRPSAGGPTMDDFVAYLDLAVETAGL